MKTINTVFGAHKNELRIKRNYKRKFGNHENLKDSVRITQKGILQTVELQNSRLRNSTTYKNS